MLEVANSDGNSMGSGFVAATENLSLDGLEESEENAVALRSGGGIRRILSVNNRFFSPKLLGILIVSQQFSTASADGICHAFESIGGKKFDLIGLISTLGTAAATKSLSFAALNDGPFYVTGHIGPGSLSVAAALFEATGSRLAQLLALGGTGDAHKIVQLDCPDGLHYIGLKSNTECPVHNTVGANVVREHQSLWKDKPLASCLMVLTGEGEGRGQLPLKQKGRDEEHQTVERPKKERDAKRKVKVIILEVGRPKEKDVRVLLKARKGDFFLLGWLPLLLTVGVIAISCRCNQWFVAGLIALGTLGMMVGVLGLRLCLFKYFKPVVAEAAPPGDCLVVDDRDADTLHIIMGEEESIQALLQRNIDCQAFLGKYVLFVAGCILYVYVVASVLYLPNVPVSGQVLFAIANLIGLVTDMLKASKNGKLGLARKAREQFEIVARNSVVFGNRTAAVAFVAKHAGDRSMLRSKKLLPCDGPVWEKWWEVLPQMVGSGDEADDTLIEEAAADLKEPKDQTLLKTLLRDMRHGLSLAYSFQAVQLSSS